VIGGGRESGNTGLGMGPPSKRSLEGPAVPGEGSRCVLPFLPCRFECRCSEGRVRSVVGAYREGVMRLENAAVRNRPRVVFAGQEAKAAQTITRVPGVPANLDAAGGLIGSRCCMPARQSGARFTSL
jgi:hypothetical protein